MVEDSAEETNTVFVPLSKMCAARWLSSRVTFAPLSIRSGTCSTLCSVMTHSVGCAERLDLTKTEIFYRKESSLAVGKLRRQVKREFLMGVTTLTKGKRDSLVPKGDGVRGVFARGEGVLESECMC